MRALIPDEVIENKILFIRGEKVILDRDLAVLYQVRAIALRQQVKRNIHRFPEDFMFSLTQKEAEVLVSQNVIPSMRSFGGTMPYVFTETGVAMLSSVLNSRRAIQINIQIIRTFIRLRILLSSNKEIMRHLAKHGLKLMELDKRTIKILKVINEILDLPITLKRKTKPIGFLPPSVKSE
jgi:hypothetical protein